VLGAAAEFERALIRERPQAGRARYKRDFESGKMGKCLTADPAGTCRRTGQGQYSTGRKCSNCGAKGGRIGKSQPLGLGLLRTLQERSKVRKRALGTEEATNPIVSECHSRRKSHIAFEARIYSLIQESGVF
jgi:hypothetical protein